MTRNTMTRKHVFAILMTSVVLSQMPACSSAEPLDKPAVASTESKPMNIEQSSFGKTADGQPITLYTLKNKNGLILRLINYGAAIQSLETPDKNGKLANVMLSFDDITGYEKHKAHFGCTIGRFGNRIAHGKFTLDGKEYSLAKNNNGVHHLHGGPMGFDRVVWKGEPIEVPGGSGVRFTYLSKDGEEGYPGNMQVTVVYSLNDKNEVTIDYTATTDKTTVANLTNHSYWTLGGIGSGPVLDHEVTLNAEQYLDVDDGFIPTGKLLEVKGTKMDFTKPKKIGAQIAEFKPGNDKGGYDHCYVLRKLRGQEVPQLAARVKDPNSGRVMEILTTEPAIQFYTGNFLDGDPINGGFKQHEAFCLETQHYPDSPNQPSFPTTTLRPNETYHTQTVHRFSAEK
ncbi:MAG: aldose epimerase family protein [Planctomycetota bacterium]|nr:aldose epimerase family protein [Planctomycetota bacterium]